MTSIYSFDGRTVLVTGASSGIGRATALLLSELGARVVLLGRDVERLAQTQGQMVGEGHKSIAFDLHAADDIPQLLKQIVEETGPLSGLAHCAGIQALAPLRAVRWSSTQAMMDVNIGASLMLAKGFRQVCTGGGSIVFVASVAGLSGQPGIAAYAASKAAMMGLGRALAAEMARESVRVNCVAPGVVDTPMWHGTKSRLTDDHVAAITAQHPLGLGEPIDVANAIAFLLSDAARWITGVTLPVDGGFLLD